MRQFIFLTLVSLFLFTNKVSAQEKYFSKNAIIAFDAEGKLDDVEDIKAQSNTATCVYDSKTGNMEWSVNVKSFKFANSLMQEHFNENYLESDKFPKATFKGQTDKPIDLTKNGTYQTKVKGKLTIHGVTKDVDVNGAFVVKDGVVSSASKFEVALKDYNIEVPTVVFMKVAETVKIEIKTVLQVLKK
ncbi:MAG: YceI family protein [Saprospiraceae bacterium]|nr:YceI family protein [Saprospiraceae bacterium]